MGGDGQSRDRVVAMAIKQGWVRSAAPSGEFRIKCRECMLDEVDLDERQFH